MKSKILKTLHVMKIEPRLADVADLHKSPDGKATLRMKIKRKFRFELEN